MEFHVPHQVRSAREFGVHLVLITLGILIALGLEQLLAAHHRAQLGRAAVAAFRRELGDNRADAVKMIAAMPLLRAQISQTISTVNALPPGAHPRVPLSYPSLRFYLMSSASWDTAIATQALNEVPPEEAKRYSAAYGAFRLFQEEERSGLGSWQELNRFGADAALLTPEQRLRLIEQLYSYAGFTFVVELVGKGTLETCDEALR